MIVNGVIISKDKNKFQVREGIKLIKKASGLEGIKGSSLSNVKKANGLSNVKKYGSGLTILQ